MTRSPKFFLAAVILLHIFFFFIALQLRHIYLNDSQEYLQQSENLKQPSLYAGDLNEPANPYLVSRRPPGYAAFILVCKSVFNSDYFVLAVQCLWGIFNFLLLTRLIKKFYPQFAKWGLMSFLLLFFPTQFIYANMIMAEVIFQSAILLYIFFLIEYSESKKSKHIWLAQSFMAMALLIKPVMYLFWILQVFFFVWLVIKKKHSWNLFATLFLPLSIILLFSFRNYHKTGYWHYSSVNNNYLLNYAARIMLHENNSAEHAQKKLDMISVKADSASDYSEYSEIIRRETFKILHEDKLLFAWLSFKKAINFFLDHGRFDLFSFLQRQPDETLEGWKFKLKHEGFSPALSYLEKFNPVLLSYLFCIMVANIFIAICFLIFIFSRKNDLVLRIAVASLVFYLVVLTGLASAARFRMAVYPVLLFAVPFGLQWLHKNIFRRTSE